MVCPAGFLGGVPTLVGNKERKAVQWAYGGGGGYFEAGAVDTSLLLFCCRVSSCGAMCA